MLCSDQAAFKVNLIVNSPWYLLEMTSKGNHYVLMVEKNLL